MCRLYWMQYQIKKMKNWVIVIVMIIMIQVVYSDQLPKLFVSKKDISFSTSLYRKQKRSFKTRVRCNNNQQCIDKYNCKQNDDDEPKIVNEIVHVYRPSRQDIRRWGRTLLCNKYNSPSLCFSNIRPRFEEQISDLGDNQDQCSKSYRSRVKITSDVNITSIGNNLNQKCEFDIKYKTADCKGLTFNIGYNITEQLKHMKPISKYIRLDLNCDSSFDLVYFQGEDSCGMQQTKTKTRVLNMPFQITNRKERQFIRKMAKLVGLFAATEVGVRSNLNLTWSSNSTQ